MNKDKTMPPSNEEALRQALRKLATEVHGLHAFKSEVIAAIRFTNWSVLQLRADEALAALSQAQEGVPAIAREIPREPTVDMMLAGMAVQEREDGQDTEGVWKAMYDAAPQPPAQEGVAQEPVAFRVAADGDTWLCEKDDPLFATLLDDWRSRRLGDLLTPIYGLGPNTDGGPNPDYKGPA